MTDIYSVILRLTENEFEVTELCNMLEVSRSAFYAWLNASPNIYQQQDTELQPMVLDIFQQHRRRYGARRISVELQSQGKSCSRSKARKIMDQAGLVAIQPKSFKPRTTESKHKLGYDPNLLLEGIEIDRINQVWVGDITYISLPGKFAYLAILLDLHSRKIVGWSLDMTCRNDLLFQLSRQPSSSASQFSD